MITGRLSSDYFMQLLKKFSYWTQCPITENKAYINMAIGHYYLLKLVVRNRLEGVYSV